MKVKGGILVFAEQEDNILHPIIFEILGKGRDLADKMMVDLSVVLLGYGLREEAKNLIKFGADRVFLFDDSSLQEFDVINYSGNMVNLVNRLKPEIFLLGATLMGRTLAPRIAAALRTGLTADCIDLELDRSGRLVQIRPAFSGNIIAHIRTKTDPQMATIRYKVMRAKEENPDRNGDIICEIPNIIKKTGMKTLRKLRNEEIKITEAEIIVSGGRGLKEQRDLKMLEDLAKSLGGVVGSSKPLVDTGWIGRNHQVGFSGSTVKPKLYIACGISGASQHLFGMRDSDIIVAINNDPSAPIFNVADYGIVDDIYEILPLLTQELNS